MNIQKIFILSILVLLLGVEARSQQQPVVVNADFNNLPLEEFINRSTSRLNLHFYYQPDSLPAITIRFSNPPQPLIDVLRQNLKMYHVMVSMDKQGNVFLVKHEGINTKLPANFFSFSQKKAADSLKNVAQEQDRYLKTQKEYFSKTHVVGTRKAGVRITNATVSGRVLSFTDSVPLVGATIYVEDMETGTATDDEGRYSLTMPKGLHTLIVRNVGYEEAGFKVRVLSSGKLDLYLFKKVFLMEAVEIRSDANHNVKSTQMGVEKITLKEMKEIPVVLGERDVIKVALLLPGVQTIGEGSSGFNVRGSPADQNLFYIGDVPVYNTSHLFGFFSAFNPDAVSEFTLYKSSIPAHYGGRLSSIFEITPVQGNMQKFSARGGISPITARLLVEGPVIKDKLTYMAGFRSTYSDWVLNFVTVPEIKDSRGNFGDAIVNLAYNLNDNNQLKLFSYYSYDRINLASKVDNSYENTGASASWFHTFNSNHSFDLSLAYSKYSFKENNFDYMLTAYSLDYELQHYQATLDFTLKPAGKHTVKYGASSILYKLDNGQYLPYNTASLVVPEDLGSEQGLESAIFLSDEWKISPLLTIYGGLRYNYYMKLGPEDVFQYQANSPKIQENIIDTLHFGNNEPVKTYGGLDVRLSAKYLLTPDLSVKASYNNLHQYIFMLSNTVALSPTDKWKLTGYNIRPMYGDQYSLGVYSNLMGERYEVSLEGYYKQVHDLVEYKDGADLVVNRHPEQDVLQGELESYGVELMIRKPAGKLNGWLNYTYSRALVVVDNPITGEQNNFGLQYPANYDKPHSFNLVANYKISKRISFSGNIVYSTGRPITYPTSVYYQDGQKILNYSLRNEYRIPDYFRTDLSVKIEGNLKKHKFLHGSWIVSVYNVTGRKNAYSVYFRTEDGFIRGYKLSIFGVPIFSITYDFKLGNYAD